MSGHRDGSEKGLEGDYVPQLLDAVMVIATTEMGFVAHIDSENRRVSLQRRAVARPDGAFWCGPLDELWPLLRFDAGTPVMRESES